MKDHPLAPRRRAFRSRETQGAERDHLGRAAAGNHAHVGVTADDRNLPCRQRQQAAVVLEEDDAALGDALGDLGVDGSVEPTRCKRSVEQALGEHAA